MANNEILRSNFLGTLKRLVIPKHQVYAPEKLCITSSCTKHELLIKHFEQRWLLNIFNQFNCLVIVFELDTAPIYSFFRILLLLFGKHMLVKLLLQLFVGIIYAKLFKSIFLKYFKSKDVKKTDKIRFFAFVFLSLLISN